MSSESLGSGQIKLTDREETQTAAGTFTVNNESNAVNENVETENLEIVTDELNVLNQDPEITSILDGPPEKKELENNKDNGLDKSIHEEPQLTSSADGEPEHKDQNEEFEENSDKSPREEQEQHKEFQTAKDYGSDKSIVEERQLRTSGDGESEKKEQNEEPEDKTPHKSPREEQEQDEEFQTDKDYGSDKRIVKERQLRTSGDGESGKKEQNEEPEDKRSHMSADKEQQLSLSADGEFEKNKQDDDLENIEVSDASNDEDQELKWSADSRSEEKEQSEGPENSEAEGFTKNIVEDQELEVKAEETAAEPVESAKELDVMPSAEGWNENKSRFGYEESIGQMSFGAKSDAFQFSTEIVPDEPTGPVRVSRRGKKGQSEDTVQLDRALYYKIYERVQAANFLEKWKNNFLNSRLASYYARRKMLYVLREQTFHAAEIQSKYERELDGLEELHEANEREQSMNRDEVDRLRREHATKSADLAELLGKLQSAEIEYAKGLTFDKTGKNNMDKVTERFIKRQNINIAATTKLRQDHIKLKNRINEKRAALDELDHLGPGFHIADYQQLRFDSRDLHDKLDEKENELIRLRKACQHAMQILAHNREKTSLIDLDMVKFKDHLEEVTLEYEDLREQLHYLRQERDDYRKLIKNIQEKYGLLTNRKLLRDLENSIKEVEFVTDKLDCMKSEYYTKSKQVVAVRKNMEYFLQKKHRDDADRVKEKSSEISGLKRRSSQFSYQDSFSK